MYIPPATRKQKEIDAAIERVQRSIGNDVTRIRYEIGKDWADEWSIFFRVVLTDDAAKNRLRDVASKIEGELSRQLDFGDLGVYPYHNFRSDSEQAKLQEPAWA